MRGRFLIGAILVAALVAFPVAAPAKQRVELQDPLAAWMCGQERAKLGKRAFRNKYGFGHPGRACMKVTRQLINAAGRIAAGDCRAELADLGPRDFIEVYGADLTSTVPEAIDACIAETIDAILYPERQLDDGH